MRFARFRTNLSFWFALSCTCLYGQDVMQQPAIRKEDEGKISLLVYTRIIRNDNGSFRVDGNLVPNFRLNRLLRLELGLRQGATAGDLRSYNHYKAELQTRYIFEKFRVLIRLSDRIVRYPSPVFSNSNYLMIAESRFPVGRSFMLLAAVGYVYTFQKNALEDWPISTGASSQYPTYKLALRYSLSNKGYVEAAYGAYDVFNPYPIAAPFLQTSLDHPLSHRCILYSYFRYQFNQRPGTPLNEFVCAGVKVRIS